jgi:hypothetical protein
MRGGVCLENDNKERIERAHEALTAYKNKWSCSVAKITEQHQAEVQKPNATPSLFPLCAACYFRLFGEGSMMGSTSWMSQ